MPSFWSWSPRQPREERPESKLKCLWLSEKATALDKNRATTLAPNVTEMSPVALYPMNRKCKVQWLILHLAEKSEQMNTRTGLVQFIIQVSQALVNVLTTQLMGTKHSEIPALFRTFWTVITTYLHSLLCVLTSHMNIPCPHCTSNRIFLKCANAKNATSISHKHPLGSIKWNKYCIWLNFLDIYHISLAAGCWKRKQKTK